MTTTNAFQRSKRNRITRLSMYETVPTCSIDYICADQLNVFSIEAVNTFSLELNNNFQ